MFPGDVTCKLVLGRGKIKRTPAHEVTMIGGNAVFLGD